MKVRLFVFFLVLLFSFIVTRAVAVAGTNIWTSTEGPEGGKILATAVDPKSSDTIYAIAAGKIFKSIDNGKNWLPLTILPGWPQTIVIDPSDSAKLYIGSDAGIYKSIDSGVTWTLKNAGRSVPWVNFIAIDPQDTRILYASGGGFYKSVNSGEDWFPIQSDQLVSQIRSIAIDPMNPAILFVAGSSGLNPSISRSDDGGKTWNFTGFVSAGVSHLAIDPIHTNVLYALAYSNYLYRTTDGGKNWSPVLTGTSITAVGIDPSDSALYVAQFTGTSNRVLISMDQGNIFKKISGANPLKSAISSFAFASDGSKVFAGTEAGILRSQKSGKKWIVVNSGLIAAETRNIAISRSGIVYAGTRFNGLFKMRNSEGWDFIRGLPGNEIASLRTDPHSNDTIFVSIGTFQHGKGILKSVDASFSWIPINKGLNDLYVPDIRVAASNPNVLYASTGKTLFKSVNGGENWKKLDWNCGGGAIVLAIDPMDARKVYAGFAYPGTLDHTGIFSKRR